jgi:hypothetical protein
VGSAFVGEDVQRVVSVDSGVSVLWVCHGTGCGFLCMYGGLIDG